MHGSTRQIRLYSLVDTDYPTHSNKLKEPDQQERNGASKLIKQLEQVYPIAQDEGNTHDEESNADESYKNEKVFVIRCLEITRTCEIHTGI